MDEATSKKPATKSGPEQIADAVGLYFAGRSYREIRQSTGADCATVRGWVGRYAGLMRHIRRAVGAPRGLPVQDDRFWFAVTDGQTRLELARAVAREASA